MDYVARTVADIPEAATLGRSVVNKAGNRLFALHRHAPMLLAMGGAGALGGYGLGAIANQVGALAGGEGEPAFTVDPALVALGVAPIIPSAAIAAMRGAKSRLIDRKAGELLAQTIASQAEQDALMANLQAANRSPVMAQNLVMGGQGGTDGLLPLLSLLVKPQ